MLFSRVGRKLRIPIAIKLWNNGKLVCYTSKRIKSRIIAVIEATKFAKGFLSVRYDKGFSNTGYYNNKKDMLGALRSFTEKDLLDYLEK